MGGPKKVNEILSKYSFLHDTRVVEYIPNGGRTYKNSTSTHDLNRFYNQMWHNKLPYSREMKRILSLPKRDRLYDRTCIPKGVLQYTKSGTVYGLVADSGILVMKNDGNGNPHPYAISVMVEDKTKPPSKNRKISALWVRKRAELIRDISEGVYDFLHQTHVGKPYICKEHRGKHLGGRQ